MFSFIFSMKCKNRKSLMEKYLASFENRRFNLFRKKMIRSGRRVLLFFFKCLVSILSYTPFPLKLHELLEQIISTIIV